jgi:methyl-accepting chemotaxis protein
MRKMKFLKVYDSKPLEIQKKSKVLFVAVLTGIFVLIINLINDTVTSDYRSVIIELCLISVFCIVLLLLVKGKYRQVSTVIIFLTLAALAALVIIKPFETPHEIFKAGLYILVPISLCALIGYAAWQAVAVTACASAVITGIFVLRILPHREMIGPDDLSGFIINPLSFVILAGLFAFLIMRIEKQIIKKAEDETLINKNRVEQITELFETTKNGIEVGELLSTMSRSSVKLLDVIASGIESIKDEVGNFNAQVKTTGDANRKIVVSNRIVGNELTIQSRAMSESSKVIEKISDSINSISGEAQDKKQMIDELIRFGDEGTKHLSSSVESIEKVAQSSSNVLEITAVIEGIASRTNLLAMNAAIEAAHAGDFGKGFSVVAEEIRKLSEETNENSALIKKTLEENSSGIINATESNRKSAESFMDVLSKITVASDALRGIVEAMSALKNGTLEIDKSVNHLFSTHKNVTDSIVAMHETTEVSEHAIKNIEGSAQKLSRVVDEIRNETMGMLGEISKLDEIGQKNKLNIETLMSGIQNVRVTSIDLR